MSRLTQIGGASGVSARPPASSGACAARARPTRRTSPTRCCRWQGARHRGDFAGSWTRGTSTRSRAHEARRRADRTVSGRAGVPTCCGRGRSSSTVTGNPRQLQRAPGSPGRPRSCPRSSSAKRSCQLFASSAVRPDCQAPCHVAISRQMTVKLRADSSIWCDDATDFVSVT